MLRMLAVIVLASSALLAAQGPDQSGAENKGHANQSSFPSSSVEDRAQKTTQADHANQEPPKSHAGIEWSNWALVGVGVITLIVIGWQSAATARSADATLQVIEVGKTKDRAKIFIEISPLRAVVNGMPAIDMRIKNVGESSAYFGLCIAGVHVSKTDDPPHPAIKSAWPMRLSGTIVKKWNDGGETVLRGVNELGQYAHGQTVHIHGTIIFRDAFDDTWRVDFHRVWRELSSPYVGIWESRVDEAAKQVNKKRSKWGEFFEWCRVNFPPP